MPVPVLMPTLSPTMTEGKIASWLVKEGEVVSTSDIIVEIETDKAVMEMESPSNGTLIKILKTELDQKIKVGSLIAVILKKGEREENIETFINSFSESSNQLEVANKQENKGNYDNLIKTEEKEEEKEEISNSNSDRVKISPLAKNLANQNQIDVSKLIGSGPYGRIVKNDIELFLENSKNLPQKSISRDLKKPERVKLSNMRNTIGQRLTESKNKLPHFYLSFDVIMDKVLEIKNDIYFLDSNLKLSVNDFIIKAISLAVKNFPEFNCFIENEEVVKNRNVDISVAVSIDNGLITPIVKNADQKNLFEISKEVKELANKAKNSTLKIDEYQGGSFTVSNLGSFSHISYFTSIINMPQNAILAVASTIKKPTVELDGNIVVRNICTMTLSSDHRLIDGSNAAKFTKYLKDILEKPSFLLI